MTAILKLPEDFLKKNNVNLRCLEKHVLWCRLFNFTETILYCRGWMKMNNRKAQSIDRWGVYSNLYRKNDL